MSVLPRGLRGAVTPCKHTRQSTQLLTRPCSLQGGSTWESVGDVVLSSLLASASSFFVLLLLLSSLARRHRQGAEAEPGAAEFMASGKELMKLPLAGGGYMQVTSHAATSPPWSLQFMQGVTHEWRVMRFKPAEGTSCRDLVQSVAKVWISAPGSQDVNVRQQSDMLVLAYSRSLVAACLSTMQALGTLRGIIASSHSRSAGDRCRLRVLCVGLGGGTVPAFLAQLLGPDCHVDVAELEPAVLEAACEGMGFQETPQIQVFVEDGAAFSATRSDRGDYDCVLVDAYDAAGQVPQEFLSGRGSFMNSIGNGLLRASGGLVALNLLPDTDLGPVFDTYREALGAQGPGMSFSIQAEGTGNLIAVQAFGGPSVSRVDGLRSLLLRAAEDIDKACKCPFNIAQLVDRDLRLWPDTDGW